MDTTRDPQLWRIAKKRAGFKRHLLTYLLVNGGLWLLWYFTEGRGYFDTGRHGGFNPPWPFWATVGWGIGIFFNFLGAYGFSNPVFSADQEYERLKRNRP